MIAPRQKVNILVRKFAPKKSSNEVNSNTNGTEINDTANEKKDEEAIQLYMNDYSNKLKKVKKEDYLFGLSKLMAIIKLLQFHFNKSCQIKKE